MKQLLNIVFAAAISVVSSVSASAAVVDVALNRAELVNLGKPMAEVMIANPEIADVVVHGSSKVSVIGKEIGSTNLRFFDSDANLIMQYDIIVGYDLPGIRRALKRFFPDQNVKVETINNSLAVSGVVPDAQTANRVMQVIYEFVKESRRIGDEEDDYTESDNRFPGVVNLLTLNSGQQVMLKVRIGEVQRDALKKLGFSLQALDDLGDAAFSFGSGRGLALFDPDLGFGFLDGVTDNFATGSLSLSRGDFNIAGVLDALERDEVFKLLAEPNLTTVSGETASFLAGGEFPIRSIGSEGEIDVEFKEFGVSLSFTPYVLAQNRIRLVVSPELSELAGVVDGIPSLTSRRATTTVELAPGESFMVAGLIRDQINSAVDELPGV
ncbi:MAG: hypothetical protein COV36_04795, partial [Alphaproteobacteria bacterium CG11_big_fil_rev_8_21_14_0_20_44_7]